ncbi:MAG: LacI family DNA-binding transcriptional regulator [Erysipelotrichaceae bacterium]|nr:LacI family DNA-binding transcriptional regulator [Erysipelotrichaceae bacterium]
MHERIGIKEVAAKAGVSVSTVSKVLKNYTSISSATREKVMKVVEETGYIPNTVASALSSKQKNRIAVFINVNDKFQQIDEINMLYILGAFDEARRQNLELVTVFNDSIDKLSDEETLGYFHSLFADSIIVFGLNRNDTKMHYLFDHGNYKMVIVDADIVTDNISSVMIDHCQGQYDVAASICDFGDTVLYLKGKDDGYVTDMRLAGMKRLAAEKKLNLDIVSGDFSEDKAYEIVRNLTRKYDAIVCASDLMAIGARRALPEGSDIRISGFDGIRLLGYIGEEFVTCRQDFYRIGGAAVKAAQRLREGEKGERTIIPYDIKKIRNH